MKAFKLREQQSFIKILKEPPLEKKKVNWSQRVFILIFVIAAGLVIRKIYNANVIIFADGQIELPKQTISFANDIQLINPWIQEGQNVCQGDTLFAFKVIPNDRQTELISMTESRPVDWILKEKITLKNKIETNKLKIDFLKQQISITNQNLKIKEELLLNGLHREHNGYLNLKQKKKELESEIKLLTETNKLYRRSYRSLKKSELAYANLQTEENELYKRTHYFISPKDGIVSDIFYEANEICYKKEEMLTIHGLDQVSVSTYFDPDELNHLHKGDLVEVSFPDGSTSAGMIDKFFVSTYALPSEFQKKYEPTERNIVAAVVPLDEWGQKQWKNFYKMDVVVRKYRYHWKDYVKKWINPAEQRKMPNQVMLNEQIVENLE